MGERNFVEWFWSHDQDGCHKHIWYKDLQNLKAYDLGLWYKVSLDLGSNDDGILTLRNTYKKL